MKVVAVDRHCPRRGRWRRHIHGDGYGYGWLLVLILISIGFQMAAPETDLARVLTIVLQGFTLIAALRRLRRATVADPLRGDRHAWSRCWRRRRPDRLRRARPRRRPACSALLFVILAPTAIVVGVVRQARARRGRSPLRTMFGVLCVYLLIGGAFAIRLRG